MRRRGKIATSEYKGVYLYTSPGGQQYWRASVSMDGKSKHIGTFPTEEDAAMAYDEVASKNWGEFAVLNFPDGE